MVTVKISYYRDFIDMDGPEVEKKKVEIKKNIDGKVWAVAYDGVTVWWIGCDEMGRWVRTQCTSFENRNNVEVIPKN